MMNGPWADYDRLQSMLKATTEVTKAAGIEAAMSELLASYDDGRLADPAVINNLVVNRVRKERRRRAILYSVARLEGPEVAVSDAAESRLTLVKCADICGESDFSLLVGRAAGISYGELSRVSGINENTLKIRVHRARKKILPLAA